MPAIAGTTLCRQLTAPYRWPLPARFRLANRPACPQGPVALRIPRPSPRRASRPQVLPAPCPCALLAAPLPAAPLPAAPLPAAPLPAAPLPAAPLPAAPLLAALPAGTCRTQSLDVRRQTPPQIRRPPAAAAQGPPREAGPIGPAAAVRRSPGGLEGRPSVPCTPPNRAARNRAARNRAANRRHHV